MRCSVASSSSTEQCLSKRLKSSSTMLSARIRRSARFTAFSRSDKPLVRQGNTALHLASRAATHGPTRTL